jgi:glycosyltransferase domain-containing protein
MAAGALEDPRRFALIIPTYEGTAFLRRALDYLGEIAYPGRLVLADDSSGEHRSFAESAAGLYPELAIELHGYPHGTRFLAKVIATLERVEAGCVMLCAQDDFVVPDALERLVARLEADPGLSASRGQVARFKLLAGADIRLIPHPMKPHPETDPVERVLQHLRDFCPMFYSVHRRELLIESLRLTEAKTRNVIFFQYLSSCVTAFQGRIDCTDELFYLRQSHPASWAAQLNRDYEHWPLLMASPDYSRYYGEFRSALLELMAGANGAATADLGGRIDDAYLEVVRRSFCQVGESNPLHDAFYQRLQKPGTREISLLQSVVRFCREYPDTC